MRRTERTTCDGSSSSDDTAGAPADTHARSSHGSADRETHTDSRCVSDCAADSHACA